ncbi:hypothetical protein D9757_007446 [Collybiopsis confluens]|uniref:ASST-domain-containing protein n=1 Tax=Collybiopsis confluens TaxID=2823264 RepID=A0A8H5M8L5_9AGAR|nr:hypothetical protein D9757_007446 [Collybiopsis confluens]
MRFFLLVSASLFSTLSGFLPVLASVAFCRNQNYEMSDMGPNPRQTYKAAPFSPPQINYVVPPAECPFNREVEGYFFSSPLSADNEAFPISEESIIMAPDGTLVYSAFPSTEVEFTYRLEVQSFKGKDHLVVWIGTFQLPGYGSGYNLLLDNTYTVVANITVTSDLKAGADLHELQITSNDTAVMTGFPIQSANLSAFGGPENGFIVNCIAQETNITTGAALFTWHVLDHVDPSESFAEIGQVGTGMADDPWDFFHINSIQKLDDGNYFISSRHCHTLYLVSPAGKVIWRMGGKKSDFILGPGTNFTWQHHARMHDASTISVFNNGAAEWDQDFAFSQGLLLKYDLRSMTVSLINARTPFNKTSSLAEGSVQILDDGTSIVGWGTQPYFSQHDQRGDISWAAQFGITSTSYRIFLHNWVGHPAYPPSAQLSNSSTFNNVTMYAWWNGATEVRAWQLLGGKSAAGAGSKKLGGPVSKVDFETTLTYDGKQGQYKFYQVEALDASGHILGHSNFTSLVGV